eukprot:357916-Chlamydomonas_euryale.AAC.11
MRVVDDAPGLRPKVRCCSPACGRARARAGVDGCISPHRSSVPLLHSPHLKPKLPQLPLCCLQIARARRERLAMRLLGCGRQGVDRVRAGAHAAPPRQTGKASEGDAGWRPVVARERQRRRRCCSERTPSARAARGARRAGARRAQSRYAVRVDARRQGAGRGLADNGQLVWIMQAAASAGCSAATGVGPQMGLRGGGLGCGAHTPHVVIQVTAQGLSARVVGLEAGKVCGVCALPNAPHSLTVGGLLHVLQLSVVKCGDWGKVWEQESDDVFWRVDGWMDG